MLLFTNFQDYDFHDQNRVLGVVLPTVDVTDYHSSQSDEANNCAE